MYKIAHINVTAATVSTVLSNDILLDFETAIASTPLGRKLQNLALVECDIGIRIVVQGQPFSAGKVIYSFRPTSRMTFRALNTTTVVPQKLNPVNSMLLPHIEVDPGASETYDLILPNVSPTGAYGMIPSTTIGSYMLTQQVINPLISGTATTPTMNVCIYMWLKNPKLEGPTVIPLSSSSREQTSDGLLSYAVRKAGQVASSVAPVFPAASPALTLFSAVASPLASVLSWFGFRKPQVTDNNFFVQNREVDNWSQIDGKSTAYVLADTAFVNLSIDPKVGCGVGDEMSLSWVCAQPGLISTYSITPALGVETQVTSFSVHPTITLTDGAVRFPTPLGGVASMFAYWSGDLTFDVEVIASIFHRCTLMVAYDASYAAPNTVAFQEALQTLPNVTIAVSGRSRTSITLPYRLNSVWADVGTFVAPASNTTVPYYNGKLYLYVVNPLTSNGSTDPIAVNFYISSKNFDFQFPRMNTLNAFETVVEPLSAPVVFGSTDSKEKSLLSFGVKFNSVKEIASKMSRAVKIQRAVTAVGTIPFVGMQFANIPFFYNSTTVPPQTPLFSETETSFVGWIAQAYYAYRGGLRHTLHVDTGEFNMALGQKIAYTTGNFGATPFTQGDPFYDLTVIPSYPNSQTMVAGGAASMDIVVPQIHPFKFSCPSTGGIIGFPGQVVFVQRIEHVPVDSNLIMTVHSGAADDASFGFFIGWPPVTSRG